MEETRANWLRPLRRATLSRYASIAAAPNSARGFATCIGGCCAARQTRFAWKSCVSARHGKLRGLPTAGNTQRKSGCSMDNQAIVRLVHGHHPIGWFPLEQFFCHGIAHQFFDGIAHRTRAEFGMKSFSHEKRQHRFVQFKFVAARGEKLDFTRQKLFGNLQLVFVAQTVEHQLFVDARENFRAQGLLCAGQNVAFQCRVVGMLQAHQFGGADVGSEPDIEAAEVQRLARRHRDARGVEQLQHDVQHARMRFLRFVK